MSVDGCDISSEDFQKKNLFHQKVDNLPVKKNSVIIATVEKYNKLIAEVEIAKTNVVKTAIDLRRLHRYDVLLVKGEKKLIQRKVDENDNTIKYFVYNRELFDIIHKAHIQTGHGGRNILEKKIQESYLNVTRKIIMIYLELCVICEKNAVCQKKIWSWNLFCLKKLIPEVKQI